MLPAELALLDQRREIRIGRHEADDPTDDPLVARPGEAGCCEELSCGSPWIRSCQRVVYATILDAPADVVEHGLEDPALRFELIVDGSSTDPRRIGNRLDTESMVPLLCRGADAWLRRRAFVIARRARHVCRSSSCGPSNLICPRSRAMPIDRCLPS